MSHRGKYVEHTSIPMAECKERVQKSSTGIQPAIDIQADQQKNRYTGAYLQLCYRKAREFWGADLPELGCKKQPALLAYRNRTSLPSSPVYPSESNLQ